MLKNQTQTLTFTSNQTFSGNRYIFVNFINRHILYVLVEDLKDGTVHSKNEYGRCQFVFSEYIVTGLKLKYLAVYVLFQWDIEIREDGNAMYYYKIYMI